MPESATTALAAALGTSVALTMALVVKAVVDFTRTGPQIKDEIQRHFFPYAFFATGRLALFAFAFILILVSTGIFLYGCLTVVVSMRFTIYGAALSGLAAAVVIVSLQFCRHLLHTPSSIAVSYQYRLSRLYPLWRRLSPRRIKAAAATLALLVTGLLGATLVTLLERGEQLAALGLAALLGVTLLGVAYLLRSGRGAAGDMPAGPQGAHSRPNLLLIGADTLRADRLGVLGREPTLTPELDALAQLGTVFANCFTPLARTAPSLVSLFTGKWPHHHGVRSNYVSDEQARLDSVSLPKLLNDHGYETMALTDWSGADLGKLDFGFKQICAPDDQWNLKLYLRQGPMDLRLFLSLFTHNNLGRALLPELYYLAGIPLTTELGQGAREALTRFARHKRPFCLNVFFGTTHAPFGSEYPFYLSESSPDYAGESKFVMSRLADPMEIIEKQGLAESDFDVPQIKRLYDSCVRRFDLEVARLRNHLLECGLETNTIIVVYSDHGTDFFETGTWGQGNSVMGDDPSYRVPIVVADPRQPGSGVVTRTTRTIDLLPTLCELLDLPLPDDTDGESLVPYLRDAGEDLGLAAYMETGIWLGPISGMDPRHVRYPMLLDLLEVPDKATGTLAINPMYKDVIVEAKDRAIRTDRWKLVCQPLIDGPRFMLFDVQEDPGCTLDRSADFPAVARELRFRLMAWVADGQPSVSKPATVQANGDSGAAAGARSRASHGTS